MTSRAEFIAAVALCALMLGLKVVNATRYRFDSDESQHLHVVWGWARGFVQYRDIFDNHMPLFQIAMAPIYQLFGDRADILYWMRFILLPLYLIAVWCTYRIGELCFSRRVGVWAAILAGSYPGYHFCSLEFRTDNLWAPLWLLTVVVLLEGKFTMRRVVVAGFLLGLCFGVSMKSVLLLASLLVGAALAFAFIGPQRLGLSWAQLLRLLGAFVATAAIVPGIVIAAFVAAGQWHSFRYWVFENNIVPGLTNHPAWWIWALPLLFPLVMLVGRRLIHAAPDLQSGFRRGFLILAVGFYMSSLWSFWSLVTRQDYLPWHPLAFILYTAALLTLAEKMTRASVAGWVRVSSHVLPPLAVVIEIVAIIYLHPFWIDGAADEAELLRETLAVTQPGDFVVDEKGETVFRQRAFAPIWEPCIMERIHRGLMIDNAADRCVATRSCVAVLGKDISADARRFIADNYLPVSERLRIAGAWLHPSRAGTPDLEFETVIPASYEILARAGPAAGNLDGQPYDGSRFLSPGRHVFLPSVPEGDLVALWAQAADRHFTPFHS